MPTNRFRSVSYWRPDVPELDRHWKSNLQQGLKPTPALSDAINTMRETVERGWGVPQRFSATMREIWMFQPQFENRKGARPHKLFAQARFRAAYDFLLLRAETGNADRALAEWWTAFQTASAEQRTEMTKTRPPPGTKNEGQAKNAAVAGANPSRRLWERIGNNGQQTRSNEVSTHRMKHKVPIHVLF